MDIIWLIVLALCITILIVNVIKGNRIEATLEVIIILLIFLFPKIDQLEETIKSTSTCESEIATVKED